MPTTPRSSQDSYAEATSHWPTPTRVNAGDSATCYAPGCDWSGNAPIISPRQESDGKVVGVGNARAGNAWLKWAFSEAAVLSSQKDDRMKTCLAKLQSKHGSGKGLSIFAHKLGRVVYHLLRAKKVFDVERFARG
jgi:hypothetical protein